MGLIFLMDLVNKKKSIQMRLRTVLFILKPPLTVGVGFELRQLNQELG